MKQELKIVQHGNIEVLCILDNICDILSCVERMNSFDVYRPTLKKD